MLIPNASLNTSYSTVSAIRLQDLAIYNQIHHCDGLTAKEQGKHMKVYTQRGMTYMNLQNTVFTCTSEKRKIKKCHKTNLVYTINLTLRKLLIFLLHKHYKLDTEKVHMFN